MTTHEPTPSVPTDNERPETALLDRLNLPTIESIFPLYQAAIENEQEMPEQPSRASKEADIFTLSQTEAVRRTVDTLRELLYKEAPILSDEESNNAELEIRAYELHETLEIFRSRLPGIDGQSAFAIPGMPPLTKTSGGYDFLANEYTLGAVELTYVIRENGDRKTPPLPRELFETSDTAGFGKFNHQERDHVTTTHGVPMLLSERFEAIARGVNGFVEYSAKRYKPELPSYIADALQRLQQPKDASPMSHSSPDAQPPKYDPLRDFIV